MLDPLTLNRHVITLLDTNHVEYKLFTHRAALTYEDLAEVQQEAGFIGTEMKCMVLKVDDAFVVYVTLQGNRVNLDAVTQARHAQKARLATPDELKEYFGAEPGCAYPFGFDAVYDISVDPQIYDQEWLLFSPVLPTQTVQARGIDLRRVFGTLKNTIHETTDLAA